MKITFSNVFCKTVVKTFFLPQFLDIEKSCQTFWSLNLFAYRTSCTEKLALDQTKTKIYIFLPEKCQISSAITVHLHDFNSRKNALLSPPSPSFSYYFWAKTTISRIWDKKNKVRKSWGAGHTHVWCNYDIKMKYKYTSTSR